MREYLYILIIAAAVTYLLTPLVRRGAIAINAQHAPRSRDVHTAPTPLLGGLAMYGGLVAGAARRRAAQLPAAGLPLVAHRRRAAAGGRRCSWSSGIVDDRWEIGAISKLAGQIAAGGIVVWSGAYLPWIPLAGRRDACCLSRT